MRANRDPEKNVTKAGPVEPRSVVELGSASPEAAADWLRLWFELCRHDWQSLAIVPAHPAASSLGVARRLVEIAKLENAPVDLLDARRLTLGETRPFLDQIRQLDRENRSAIVALDSPLERPSAIPVARGVSAAVLVVPLGDTRLDLARRVVEDVGRGRFIGSIAVRPLRG